MVINIGMSVKKIEMFTNTKMNVAKQIFLIRVIVNKGQISKSNIL